MEEINSIGKSPIKSFRYAKEYCIVTLVNGVQGVVGKSSDFPFPTMLTLKGAGMQMNYKSAGADADGRPKYWLDFDLQ